MSNGETPQNTMEENPPISENISDWEQIQSHYWPHPSSTAITGAWDDAEFGDGFIFPPDHHESLPVPQLVSSPVELAPEEEDVVGPVRVSGGAWQRGMGLLRCGILRVAVAVGNFGGWRGVFWSCGGVAGVVAAAWLWVRLRPWRVRFQRNSGERVVELITERDQKIRQLLLQISQMNELLSARRSVPVIRIIS